MAAAYPPPGVLHAPSSQSQKADLEHLRQLQQYRRANQELFMGQAKAPLTTQPPEILSVPTVPYKITSYQVDDRHQVQPIENADADVGADEPPLVHVLPPAARYTRVSVPRHMAKPLQKDSAKPFRRRPAAAAPDASVSLYAHIAPRTFPRHISHPKKSESLDIRQAVPPSANGALHCDPEQFLYSCSAPYLNGLAGKTIPNFRSHYKEAGKVGAQQHPMHGIYQDRTCELVSRTASIRAGLQVLHSRLWRRSMNPYGTTASATGRFNSPFPNL